MNLRQVTIDGYDASTNSVMTSGLNPSYAHYTDIEPIAYASTGATTVYYQEFDMASFQNFYLQIGGKNITFTLEATGDDSLWDDVGTEVIGVASFVTTGTVTSKSFFGKNVQPKKFRIVFSPDDADNSATINLRRY